MVKSGYDTLLEVANHSRVTEDFSKPLTLLWKIQTPFSVQAFGWRSFHNRLPTKDKLRSIGGLSSSNDYVCVLCNNHVQDLDHLFFSCPTAMIVWCNITTLLDIQVEGNGSAWQNFLLWRDNCRIKKGYRGITGMPWLAVMWSLWVLRNDILFNGSICNISDLLWNIKSKVWKWFILGNIQHANDSFYDFYKNPFSCDP